MTLRPSSLFSYALRALVDLSIHQVSGQVKVASIAKRQEISAQVLEQIFNRLRRKGLVVAERGPRGGYRLSKHPKEIRVSEIFESLESGKPSNGKKKKPAASDLTVGLWRQVEKAVNATLQATTLEALVTQAREQLPSAFSHRYTFHI